MTVFMHGGVICPLEIYAALSALIGGAPVFAYAVRRLKNRWTKKTHDKP